MVKLTKIYTRGGDGGKTSLGDGTRVPKNAVRVAAYGAVDEANATVGLARLYTGGAADEMLARIQDDLFDLGADLCTPGDGFAESDDTGGTALRVTGVQVARLEREIDEMNGDLAPLSSFVLPGGSAAAAHLHLARTVTRRAERLMIALMETEPVNPRAIEFVNRLSDHLFVLARHLNDKGRKDVLWRPGANR